jgi:hypothetical protein
VTNPTVNAANDLCNQWVMELLANGAVVVIPEIANYELRREFTLVGMTESIKQLDGLKSVLRYDPITTNVMLLV